MVRCRLVDWERMTVMPIVFFDLETRGLADHHPNIQIAAIATRSFAEIGVSEAKIAFDPSSVDRAALAINHYDPEVWARVARSESDVLEAFARFLVKHATVPRVSRRTGRAYNAGRAYNVACLAGHNVLRFYVRRLVQMFARHARFLPADLVRPLDTLQLALWHAAARGEQFDSYALGRRFGINSTSAHEALADVRMSARLARVLYRPEAA
jgi:DNA polymerase III epsilon subunit-like protein